MAFPDVVTGLIVKPVTQLLLARKNESQNYLADKVFPVVGGLKAEYGEIYAIGNDHMRSFNSERAVWDESQHRIEFRYSLNANYRIQYFDLSIYLPDRVINQYEAPTDPERDAGMTLMESLLLQREVALAGALTNTAIMTQNTALTGGDRWNQTGTSTPLADLRAAVAAVRANSGYRANSMIIPQDVLDALRNHPDFTDQIVNFTVMDEDGIVSLLKKNLKLTNIYVADSQMLTSNEGQTDAFSDVWGKNVVVFYRPDTARLFTKSLGYTFELAGQTVRATKTRNVSDSGWVLKVEMQWDQKILDTNLGYLLTTVID